MKVLAAAILAASLTAALSFGALAADAYDERPVLLSAGDELHLVQDVLPFRDELRMLAFAESAAPGELMPPMAEPRACNLAVIEDIGHCAVVAMTDAESCSAGVKQRFNHVVGAGLLLSDGFIAACLHRPPAAGA